MSIFNIRKSTLIAGFTALLALTGLAGCETAEDRQLAAGQACLDNARDAAAADQCISIVQGLESESAYLIRCSANFIANGFTGNRIAKAFQQLKNDQNGSGGNGQDPMMVMMTYLIFKNGGTHAINNTIANCQRSGVLSMYRLATVANLATTVASIGGQLNNPALDPNNPSFDPSQLQQVVQNLQGSSPVAIGQIAVTANDAYCAEGSTYKDTEVCKNLGQAMAAAGGDPNNPNYGAIANQLLTLLQQ